MDFTVNHDVAGWNLVLTGVVVICWIYTWPIVIAEFRYSRSIKELFQLDHVRMIIGFAFVCLGVALRVGGWVPWRGMILAERDDLVSWWSDMAYTWTMTGVGFAILGMVLIMWPALTRFSKRLAIPFVGLIILSLYGLGVAITEVVARILKG